MDASELAVLLEEAGQEEEKTRVPAFGKWRLKRRDLKFFAESLSRLLSGGIPILQALEGMARCSSNRRLQGFIKDLSEQVKQGRSLKESLESIKAVPAFFYQIVYAGEVSGSTPLVLGELAGYLEKEEALKRKIREALAYPVFILAMGLATLGVLLQVVLPKLEKIYVEFGTELPGVTKVILAVSNAFFPFFLVLLIAVVLFVFLLVRKREAVTFLAFKAPFIGEFLRMCALIQFSRLFSLLLESGVVILRALEIVGKTLPDFLRKDIQRLREGLGEGKSISSCIGSVSWIDELSKMLVSMGEESGKLPESLGQIARDTETRIDGRIQILVKLLEPALILAIGVIVAFVVIATVLPIFDISGLVR